MSTLDFKKMEASATGTLRKEISLIIIVNVILIAALVWIYGWPRKTLFYAAPVILTNVVLLLIDSFLLLWAAFNSNPMRMFTTIPMPEKRQLRQFVLLSDSFPLALWYILQLLRGILGTFCALLFGVLHLAFGETENVLGAVVIGATLLLAVRSFYNESTIYTRIVHRPVQRVLKPASVRNEYGKQRAESLRTQKNKRKASLSV